VYIGTGAALGYVLGSRAGRRPYDSLVRAVGGSADRAGLRPAGERVAAAGGDLADAVLDLTQQHVAAAGAAAERGVQQAADTVRSSAPDPDTSGTVGTSLVDPAASHDPHHVAAPNRVKATG
jgi:hypothetical protein